MIRRSIALISLLVLLSANYAFPASKVISPLINNENIAHVAVNFLTTGPRLDHKTALRVSFVISEIYYSIVVEKISYGDTEGDSDRIVNSYYLSGDKIKQFLGIKGEFAQLDFVKWVSWNEFEAKAYRKHFRLRYLPDGTFLIKTVSR